MVFCRNFTSRLRVLSPSCVVLRMAGDGGGDDASDETLSVSSSEDKYAWAKETARRKETAVCLFYNSTVCVLDRVF